MLSKKIFLPLIIIAAFFRFWDLQTIPPHPSLDEVSIGYNAFSLLKTGKDEFGERLPILLRAYDDYRPAHYTYLVIPFVKAIGLSVLAVRLPSAILSITTVISVYFLVLYMFEKNKKKTVIAFLTVGFFAVSPWHVYISRLGHEVNLFFSSFIFAMTFFYIYLAKKKGWQLIVSSACFAVSFSAYQSGKIFVPLMLLMLMLVYYKSIISRIRIFVISALLFVLLCLPIIMTSTHPQALVRFHATNIYSLSEPYLKSSAEKVLQANESGDVLGQIVNNRRWVYILLPTHAYVSHFNVWWLFHNGGDEPFKSPNLGLLHVFELPLILIGIFAVFRLKSLNGGLRIVISAWILLSVIPAAITTGFPHAMRTLQVLPVPHLLSALGVVWLYGKVGKRTFFSAAIGLLVLWGSISLYTSYFVKFPVNNAAQFQYGVLQAFDYVASQEEKYKEIYVSNKKNLFQSYMFYLFNGKLDPGKYLQMGGTISGGFAEDHLVGKYFFGDVKKYSKESGLFIVNPGEVQGGVVIKKIMNPKGEEMVWIVEK